MSLFIRSTRSWSAASRLPNSSQPLWVAPAACLGLFLIVAGVFLISPESAQANDPPGSVEFFENRIRPVLVNHCYECHSAEADEIGGSLLLDSSDAMIIGGDSGPAIQPGDAAASTLVSAIRYESSEMPPAGRLSDEVIEDFEAWIKAGAKDPRKTKAAPVTMRSTIDLDEGRQFWAFRPVQSSLPPPHPFDGSRGAIDQFLYQSLSDVDVVPNGFADDATRLRRLAFDLTGLPPSLELQRRWLSNPSWANWTRIVDSMLASPAFAQHWARHWMDVARYADSNGSDFNATFHEAWRYRDYLIRSFATDRPIDEMIRQQVAGDLLPAMTDQQRYDNVVASTFLMLGTKMLSERDKPKLELDVVDDQIDTVGRAFLGLTLGCARCHDHKFDPVPMDDYYALAGIFKSTVTLKGESQEYVSTWNRVSLPTSAEHRDAIQEFQSSLQSIEAKIKSADAQWKQAQDRLSGNQAGVVIDDSQATKVGTWKASQYTQPFVGVGYVHDDNSMKGTAEIRFEARLPDDGVYEVRVSYTPSSSRAAKIPVTIETAHGSRTVRLDQRKVTIAPMWSSLGEFEFKSSSPAVVTISNEGTSGYVIADAVQFLDVDHAPKIDPNVVAAAESAKAHLDGLRAEMKVLQANRPLPIPQAMAPSDRPTAELTDSPVHIRGEVRNLGPVVPRGFLRVCSSGDAAMEEPQGSGRLELADWLTDPDHPLVARVFVNRVWMHLMGQGIVRTVDNFGQRGERPSHPELLDAMAVDFMRDGWQLKPLIRDIVHSAAYQRSSQYDADAVQRDPENRLWWRMHRRRLPAEAIRDAMVSAAGLLNHTPTVNLMAGHKVLVSNNNSNSTAGKIDGIQVPRRSVFLPIVRGYLPPEMTALDMADPDLLVGRRPTTNVPGQALVLINSPTVNEWARTAADNVCQQEASFEDRLHRVYQLCLQREPSAEDEQMARDFFAGHPDSASRWHAYIAAIFAATEFRFLD
ncbi:Xanthan lyase precursor [Rubripirellula lacrimiformis]|uniref:Xanthan lyase n=1 Tax=Rubripirellula lacrimiformis TaxID=1930273 RepID=A0A517N7Y2_9BACT|nr:DUF1553 domain-containing protein [Rubripirellula lacrimiformis]QDT03253.1 Xanthan lyase precursor [Rubripirellula lacrimiformis]